MTAVERYECILQALQQEEVVMVNEIADMTGASLPTVRRDLKAMEEKKLVVRFHGGVQLAEKNADGAKFNLVNRIPVEQEAKKAIAKKAAELVEDGEIIFLDSGSTTYFMCEYLKNKNVTVVTNGIYNITRLAENEVQTFVLDGQTRPKSHCILSQDTVERMDSILIDKAFLGVRGIDVRSGFTTTDSFDCLLKNKVLSKATKSYVLADPSKFYQRKFYSYGHIQEAAIITTDARGFQAEGLEIILAVE